MKKLLVSLVSSVFILGNLSAQSISKGNFMIGSTLGFSTADSRVKVESTDLNEEGDGPSAVQINIAPNVGYFVADNFVVGGGLDYTFNSVKEPNEDEVNDSDLLFGPFFRYYLPVQNNIAFFFQSDFGFGSSSDTQEIAGISRSVKSNIFAVGFGPGLTVFSTQSLGIEALAKYNYARSNFNTTEAGVSSSTETRTNQIDLSIGLQFYF